MQSTAILSTSSPAHSDSATCGICRRQVSRYTCPSCNVPYCSLACFRSEGHAQCSESFYKRELESEIRTQPSASMDERRRMMEMLRRFEDDAQGLEKALDGGSEDEGDERDDLARRLGDIDLDSITPSELWSLLNPAERESFLKAVHDPGSTSAQELLRTASLENDITSPWWEASEALEDENAVEDVSAAKKYGKRPAMVRLPDAVRLHAQGPDAGPPLLYNICAVFIAYAYVTRHLGFSPLSAHEEEDNASTSARQLLRALVPFLVDRHSRVLFSSMDAVVTDAWAQLVAAGRAERASFVLFMRDAAKLFSPRRVAMLDSDPGVSTSRLQTAAEQIAVHNPDLETHPHHDALRALSDLVALFQHRSQAMAPAQTKETPTTAKLRFYAAHIAALPTPLLAGFSAEVVARARRLELEGEVGVPAAADSNLSKSMREEPKNVSISMPSEQVNDGKTCPVIEEM